MPETLPVEVLAIEAALSVETAAIVRAYQRASKAEATVRAYTSDVNRPGFPGGRLVWVRRPRTGAPPRGNRAPRAPPGGGWPRAGPRRGHNSALGPRREGRCRWVRVAGGG